MAVANNTWSFTPIVAAFPHTIFPNVALWNLTNGADLHYQIQVSWPLDWASRSEANGSVLTEYVLDGNALGMSATEAWRRRHAVEFTQPDYITVSIGYPITDSVYGTQRSIDFQPVTPGEDPPVVPGVREGADDFIELIEDTIRPFVRSEFPNVKFGREAIYGYSFGGLFVVYALLRRPDLFDTFLSSSPALFWNDGYILNHTSWLDEAVLPDEAAKPAFRLAYGSLEYDISRRRTETVEQYQVRRDLYATFFMDEYCTRLYESVKRNKKLRHVELKEYIGSDHASVGAVALTDGIDYFVDW